MAFVGWVMNTRPRKLVFARTYGSAEAWSKWKLKEMVSFHIACMLERSNMTVFWAGLWTVWVGNVFHLMFCLYTLQGEYMRFMFHMRQKV